MDHTAALVQNVQCGYETLQAAHLIHMAVGESVVGTHWQPVLYGPLALQLLIGRAEEVLALPVPDYADLY